VRPATGFACWFLRAPQDTAWSGARYSHRARCAFSEKTVVWKPVGDAPVGFDPGIE
jgi:hypothetical protein